MDEEAEICEVHLFRAVEFLLEVYAKRFTREQARKRVELMKTQTHGPAELAWFDVRWPEGPP